MFKIIKAIGKVNTVSKWASLISDTLTYFQTEMEVRGLTPKEPVQDAK